ncbi:hypothetical protein Bca52824_007877 [Brassica carinata]|uniref:RNase H type-1 domain-containing protein n=1 Tax=Brassica carinata TaxID=52824 RepID=A0A8X8B5P7_BRACI|nr:hypothetical protein Bca52824_007877 [Brassica carinata]
MDLPIAGSSLPPRLSPEPPDADLELMLPVDPSDPPVPPDPPSALWVYHRQISSLSTAFLHCIEQKCLLLLENYSAIWNFNSRFKKLRFLSMYLEASVLSPENPHLSSSLMRSDDQRFRPSFVKAFWLQHGNVSIQNSDLTKVYALSLNPVQLTALVWYDVSNGTLMVLVHHLASVERVHIAQSRDVVLKSVLLLFQLSQAIRVYTVFAPLLMSIKAKYRQYRPFTIAPSYGSNATQLFLLANSFQQSSIENPGRSHPPMVLSVTFLLVEVMESLEAPVHGTLGHCYIGSPLIAETIAIRSALCLELTIEFQKLKVFSYNSTFIRVISGNIQSKEVIGIVYDIRSISSGFASIGSSHLHRSKNTIAFILAKKTFLFYSYMYWTPQFGPCFGSTFSFYY